MAGSVIVGIDPGRYGYGVVVLGSDGEELLRERAANDAAGIEPLVERVTGLAGGGGQALWVIEADSGDGAVLIGELLARDEVVATLTPTEVASRRKGRHQVHKSDLIDAEIVAQIGREQQATLRRLVAMPEAVAEMRVLARYQEGLIRDRTRLINRLRFLLDSVLAGVPRGTHVRRTRRRGRDGAAHGTPDAHCGSLKERLRAGGVPAAQRYRRRPLERAKQLIAAAQVGSRPQETVYGRLVAEVATELRALKVQIETLDGEIRDRFLLQP